MNREIKFRAWNKRQKCWEEEGWCIQKHIPGMALYWMKWVDDFDEVGYEPFWRLWTIGRDLELSQFTGLKDKNGKEIYEGDIVKVKDCYQDNFSVQYSPPTYVLFDDKDGCLCEPEITRDHWKEFEIIGNIYENPELLEE